MKNERSLLTAAEIASRWNCHRATAARILSSYGHDGIKFGAGKQSMRRFLPTEVERIEKLFHFDEGDGNSGPSAQRL